MGNCFGKQSDSSDSFKSPGRTLGTAPAPNDNARASVPPKISSQSPGRTLGSAPQGAAEDSPKAAAARAAEERAKASQGKGKLGRQLDAQKSQTQAGALAQTSRDNRAARDADAAADARNYN